MIRRPHRCTFRLTDAERDNLTELQGMYGHQDESYIIRLALAELLTKRRLQLQPATPAPAAPPRKLDPVQAAAARVKSRQRR